MSEANGTLLSVRNLSMFYPVRGGFLQGHRGEVRAVDDVSFDIQAGETLGLVGRERLRQDHHGPLHPARRDTHGR